MSETKSHWEHVYLNKSAEQVSWTQPVPQTSLNFIRGFNLPKSARVIDIGGGDSRLVDYLLNDGYTDITVLDIAEPALEKAKNRLGKKSSMVKWVVSDITDFHPAERYDIWHDRATFHFLTTTGQINAYLEIAGSAVSHYMVLGTFSENGPNKCSGLPIKQYSGDGLQQALTRDFHKIKCITEDHHTPFDTVQNFLFCSFERYKHDSNKVLTL